ncbi:MAG: MBOAT family protein [Bacteroidaceae bacterium]|nr:MBOAT family protein [Bacteroidaceae bacterium]
MPPRLRNPLLLLASYAVYWLLDARCLWLLVAATAVAYALGLAIERALQSGRERLASALTTLGVTAAVALLVAFKYLDFFAAEAAALLGVLGVKATWTALHLVLPVGLSFYTFKLISYLVEIHRTHLAAERDAVAFAAYVAFFPTILAGPIDRPAAFLPQLRAPWRPCAADLAAGFRMALWGAVMKVCVADLLAPLTDSVWADGGATAAGWAFLLYPVQMYADFSGYSLMAIGAGRALGFKVAANFNRPFLARNVAEYWRRWHMSLTGWITDYVFIPLNLHWRDAGRVGQAAAVTVNLVVIGLWHGANWTYLLFGLYHAALFLPLIRSGAFARRKKFRAARWGLPSRADAGRMALTYLLVAVAFVLFRAPTVGAALGFFAHLATAAAFAPPAVAGFRLLYVGFAVAALAWEYVARDRACPLDFAAHGLLRHRAARWAVYYALLALLYTHASGPAVPAFIYTQF